MNLLCNRFLILVDSKRSSKILYRLVKVVSEKFTELHTMLIVRSMPLKRCGCIYWNQETLIQLTKYTSIECIENYKQLLKSLLNILLDTLIVGLKNLTTQRKWLSLSIDKTTKEFSRNNDREKPRKGIEMLFCIKVALVQREIKRLQSVESLVNLQIPPPPKLPKIGYWRTHLPSNLEADIHN